MEPWAPSSAPNKLGLVVQGKWRQEDQKFKVKSKTWVLNKFKVSLGYTRFHCKQTNKTQMNLSQRVNTSLNTGLCELLWLSMLGREEQYQKHCSLPVRMQALLEMARGIPCLMNSRISVSAFPNSPECSLLFTLSQHVLYALSPSLDFSSFFH